MGDWLRGLSFWIWRYAIDSGSTRFHLLDDAETHESYFGTQPTFHDKLVWYPSQYLSMCLDE